MFVDSCHSLSQLPKDKKAHIAIAGRSNVGKSSLLNKFAGLKKLAKVSSTPGKTRALNFFDINNKFYLVDLPGYGYAKVSRSISKSWGILIEEYLLDCEKLIGLILLLDCRRDPSKEDLELLDWLSTRQLPVMTVMTKSDKLSKSRIIKKQLELEKEYGLVTIPFSVVSGVGIKELTDSIFNLANMKN